MSRFYVGQRVRIVGCGEGSRASRFIGVSCRITDAAQNVLGWDMWGVDVDEGRWCFLESELEPILYDGNQLVEWDACLWQPEGQAA